MAIMTKSEVASIIHVNESDINDIWLDYAESYLEERLKKHYSDGIETMEFLLPESQYYVTLNHCNITDVEYVKIDDDELDDDSYYVYKDLGIIHYPSQFTKNTKIEIKYSYSAETPTNIEKVIFCLLILKSVIQTNPEAIQTKIIQEKIGDYTIKHNVQDLASNINSLDIEIQQLIAIAQKNIEII